TGGSAQPAGALGPLADRTPPPRRPAPDRPVGLGEPVVAAPPRLDRVPRRAEPLGDVRDTDRTTGVLVAGQPLAGLVLEPVDPADDVRLVGRVGGVVAERPGPHGELVGRGAAAAHPDGGL